jgi:hypothetical protein
MKVTKKENNGISISGNFDKKNYDFVMRELKSLFYVCEKRSNYNNLKYSVFVSGIRTPYMKVKGWCSRVIEKNGRISEVLYLDYDNCFFWIIKQELEYLMEKYNLPPFYVFVTEESLNKENNWEKGNYIVISLKKNRFKDVIEMHQDTHSDMAHQKVGMYNPYRCWVLRLGNKGKKQAPKFKCVIGNTNKKYSQEISEGHLKVLKQLYPKIPNIKYTSKDGGKPEDLFFDEYLTASK